MGVVIGTLGCKVLCAFKITTQLPGSRTKDYMGEVAEPLCILGVIVDLSQSFCSF